MQVHITQIDLFELSLTANVTLFFFKAAKGVLTAGPRKAVKYAGAKLKKRIRRLPSEGNICVSKKVKIEKMYESKCKNK